MSHSDGEEEQEEEQEPLSPAQAGDETESSDDEDEETSLARKFEELLAKLRNIDVKDTQHELRNFEIVETLANQTPWLAEKTAGDGEHNTLLHLLVEEAKDKVRLMSRE